MTSSSSSDDEDNLALLRESVDPMFIKTFAQKTEAEKPPRNDNLKSLRKTQNDDDQFNELKVTPEFQRFVAKKLSQLLDAQLTEKITNKHRKTIKKRKSDSGDGGVKLLKKSHVYLDIDFVPEVPTVDRKARRKRRKIDDEDDELEKVKAAAVEPERILAQTDIKHWAKLCTKPHFKYKQNETGSLVLVDDKKFE